MRKVYQLLMLMVLACIGINTSQAQKRYEVSDLSTPLSIDDFVGEKFVIHNGSLGDSEKDFILKSATKPFNLLLACTCPLVTEFADN